MKKKKLSGAAKALEIQKLKELYSRDNEHVATLGFCWETGVPLVRLIDPELDSITISTLEKWMKQFKKLEKLSPAFKR